MATGVHLFTSADGSAPQLTGQVGSLKAVLDAVLLTGYGATAAVSWSCPYTGTNKAIYQQAAGNSLLLRVDDNATGTGGAKEALIRGAESATDVDTLTNPMPTDAQSALTAHSLVCRKSKTADATARAWIALADDRTLYLFTQAGDIAGISFVCAFGDFFSFIAGDPWRTLLIARIVENSTAMADDRFQILQNAAITSALTGHFIQRNRNASVGSLAACKTDVIAAPATSSGFGASQPCPFPNADDGGIYLRPVYLVDPTTATAPTVRGRLRGIWAIAHAITSLADGDTWAGLGDLAGRTFRYHQFLPNSGGLVLETSDTWDTSS